jgi:hypothetical protein
VAAVEGPLRLAMADDEDAGSRHCMFLLCLRGNGGLQVSER